MSGTADQPRLPAAFGQEIIAILLSFQNDFKEKTIEEIKKYSYSWNEYNEELIRENSRLNDVVGQACHSRL